MSEKQQYVYNSYSYSSPRAPSVLYESSGYHDNVSIVSPSQFSGDGSSTAVESVNSPKVDVTVETTTAPNPYCLSKKAMTILMVLINLVILVVILGLLIVVLVPYFEPVYLWIFGIIFSMVGYLTLLTTFRRQVICGGTPLDPHWYHCPY